MDAHEEIRQLVARYAVAVDARDLDALVALFVDDVQVGKGRFGHDALREFFATEYAGFESSFLLVGTQVIDLVDDDHATGTVHCRGEIRRGERWDDQAIVYTDTYERRDGRWLFVRRKHVVKHER